jgi:hypothetical protein
MRLTEARKTARVIDPISAISWTLAAVRGNTKAAFGSLDVVGSDTG